MADVQRWTELAAAAALLLAVAFAPGTLPAAESAEDSAPAPGMRVYVGTYTRDDRSEGIYVFDFDPASGTLSNRRLAAKTTNPSFLAIRPDRKYLYAVNEVSRADDRPTGTVSAFSIDAGTGALTLLNQQPSGGGSPCHIVTDRTGRHVLVANYGGGSVASLPVQPDGQLGPATVVIQHEGSSVHPRRQQRPHAHSINVAPKNQYAVAADLGIDKVLVYRFDPRSGALADGPTTDVEPGSGPRHLTFEPSGRFAYVINELSSTITVLAWNGETGQLETVQTVSTLPDDFRGENFTAEVVAHPNGRFLYGSNRGHDSLAIFAIDQSTGRLTPAGHQSTGGKTPRNFAIAPGGRFLLAANQASDTIQVFRIDGQKGTLTPVGDPVEVPVPVCIRFLRPPG